MPDTATDFDLEACRLATGMESAEAAEKIGVSRQTLFKWERDQSVPTAEYIPGIAEAYDVDVDLVAKWVAQQNRARRARRAAAKAEAASQSPPPPRTVRSQ